MIRYSLHIDQARSLIFGLNLSEAILTDYISKTIGRNWVETVQVKGINYYWISRNKIIEEIPLLTTKPDTVYNLLKSLKDKGVIFYIKEGTKDLVRMTDSADDWGKQIKDSENFPTIFKNSEKNPSYVGKKSESYSEKNPTYNNIKNNNNNIINNKQKSEDF